ncbi:MAG: alpha/beta hydrolase, partial [Gammaproteobacteria bacterium]|nr:alpha/beta hydrolase [Gammaproteobacteria bacterium]
MQRAVLNTALAAALALPAEIPLAAVSPGPQTPDQWFDDDERRAAAVSLGRLVFLSLPPKKTVLHQYQTITIGRRSLRDGWVRLNQCFEHLDPVPLAQVVYNATRTRNLKIDSFSGIEKAWVEGASVQLADIRRGAKLCVEAE